LARKKVTISENTDVIFDNSGCLSGDWTLMLFAILACCTPGRCDDLAGCSVKALTGFGLAHYAVAHEELDLAEVHVPKSVVPTKQLFFWLGEVDVGGVDSGDGDIESFDSNWSVFERVGFRSWQSVFRIGEGHKFASGQIARDAAQNKLMGFNLNAFVRISLKETCDGEESDSDLGGIVGRDLHHLQVAAGVVDCPHHMTESFNPQSFCDSFELSDGTGTRKWAKKVVLIRRD
jgi:hypothetical protein